MNTNVLLVLAVLAALIASLWLTTSPVTVAPTEAVLAEREDLLSYPAVSVGNRIAVPHDMRIEKVQLPNVLLYVVLRGISQQEHASFMVRAVDIQLIEQRMMSLAILAPQVSEADVAAMAPELISFLKARVNELSGFPVFD